MSHTDLDHLNRFFYVDDCFILLKCLENEFSEALPYNETSILLECSCPIQDVINIKLRFSLNLWEFDLWDL